jgi:phosphatidylinositol alpha-1,6-mannosyltransferase
MAGFGPEFERIKNIIQKLNLEKRVHLLGHISDEKKNCLYQISNIFIMPNISVANDQEGFGIVAIEAGSYGIPVIASDIEGIRDAIIEGSTGHLIKEKDVQAFVKAILFHNIDKSSLRDKVLSNFDCTEIAKRYIREFESLTRKFH